MKTKAKNLRHAKRLDKASAFFFLIGFICSKLQNIPLIFVSTIFNLLSLVFYFTGYALWLAACERYPDEPSQVKSWYGAVQFKNQHKIAAVFGTLAIIACIVAIFFPPALIPAAWLFLTSNILWCVAEYHKMHQPPTYDSEYSSARQSVYMRYALLMSSASLITAVATTLVFCFPPAAFVTLITATIVCILLNLVALQDWLHFNWVQYPPDRLNHSHNTILSELNCEPGCQLDLQEEVSSNYEELLNPIEAEKRPPTRFEPEDIECCPLQLTMS